MAKNKPICRHFADRAVCGDIGGFYLWISKRRTFKLACSTRSARSALAIHGPLMDVRFCWYLPASRSQYFQG
jgi:hypothetical protein